VNEKTVSNVIDGVLASMKRIFHEQLQCEDEARPQFALICSVDPRSGSPMSGEQLGVVIVVPSKFAEEADKEGTAMTIRALAVAGEAVACVVCLDTYMASGKAAEDHQRTGIMPAEHPDSDEAMFVAIERRGHPTELECHVYHRLDDGIAFDDSSRRKVPSEAWGGRFAKILPPSPVPRAVVSSMQQLVKAGAFGDLAWSEITREGDRP
jgi:hypothetical protein